MNCINIKSKEFQSLLKETGLPSLTLEIRVASWQEKNGLDRWPKYEDIINPEEVLYSIKALSILNTDKARQVFSKGEKNKWNLDKILSELNIPKEQKELIQSLDKTDIDEIINDLLSNYSYTVEINTAKESNAPTDYVEDQSEYYENQIKYADKFYVTYERENKFIVFSNDFDISRQSSWGTRDINSPKFNTKEEAEAYRKELVNNKIKSDTEELNKIKQFKPSLENTQYYSNLTVPGGTNYTENEIATPAITPSIKGHAQFATDKGIGWFRSDELTSADVNDRIERGEPMNVFDELAKSANQLKTRRILEVQSDLFQKGRDKMNLTNKELQEDVYEKDGKYYFYDRYAGQFGEQDTFEITREKYEELKLGKNPQNQFLQLLNKDNNWVTFFVKSIIQDSAKKGYEKVLFPSGNTASKVEGHTTLEEFKKQKENRIKKIDELLSENREDSLPEYNTHGIKLQDFIKIGINNGYSNEQIHSDLIKHFNNADGEWMHFNYTDDYTPEFYGDERPTPVTSLAGFFNYIQDNEINLIDELTGTIDKNSLKKERAQLQQEILRVETEGFGALKPIYNFYENTVTNILKKQGYKPILITDEYGNTWNEIILDEKNKSQIFLKSSKNREQGSDQETLLLAKKLSDKLNVEHEILSFEEADEVAKKLGKPLDKVKSVAFWDATRNVVVLIKDRLSKNVAIHEFTHPIVEHIWQTDKPGFLALLREANGGKYSRIAMTKYLIDKGYEDAARMEISDLEKEYLTNRIEDEAVAEMEASGASKINNEKNLFQSFLDWLLSFVKKSNPKSKEIQSMTKEELRTQNFASLAKLILSDTKLDMSHVRGEGISQKQDKLRYENYKVINGMPFTFSTIERMKAGDQRITIRTRNHEDGIYVINGEQFHILNLGKKNISDFKNKEHLKKKFKGDNYEQGKFSHIDDFFEGKNELYVYQITKIDNSIKNEFVKTDESLDLKEQRETSQDTKSIITEIKDVLYKQRKIFKQTSAGKKIVSDIDQLMNDLDKNKDDVESLIEFAKTANKYTSNLTARLKGLKDKVNSSEGLSKEDIRDGMSLIRHISELTESYSATRDILSAFYGYESSPVGSDINYITDTVSRIDFLTREFTQLGRELQSQWLYKEAEPINQKLIRDGKPQYVLTKEKIKSELTLASKDIPFHTKMFGAAISSTDPITGLVARILKEQIFKANEEDRVILEDLYRVYEKNNITDHSKYMKTIEIEESYIDDSGEKKTKKTPVKAFITRLDYKSFDEARKRFKENLGERPSDPSLLKKWNRRYRVWITENTQVKSNAKEILKYNQENMTESQYARWADNNLQRNKNIVYAKGKTTLDYIKEEKQMHRVAYIDSKTGDIMMYSGELIEPSEKHYFNPEYNSVKDDEYYQALFKQYTDANNSLPPNARLKYGIIPQVEKPSIDKTLSERFSKESLADSLDVTAYDTRYKVQTLSGEEYKGIPVYYVKTMPMDLVNENLIENVLKFSQMANNYKYMEEIKPNIEVLMDLVEKRQVVKTDIFGRPILDPASVSKRMLIKSNNEAREVNERLKNFIDMVFYGEKDIKASYKGFLSGKERDLHKVTGKMMYLSSLSTLAGNITASISNRLWGNYQTIIEGLAGKDYSLKDLTEARIHYTKNIPQYLNDVGLVVGRSKDSQLIDLYDAIQGEFRDNYGNLIAGSKFRRLFNSDALFALNNMTEHQIQTVSFIATLKHYKVKKNDGQEISLYDAYEVVDSKLKLVDGVKFSEKDRFELTNRIHAMNKRMHGIYSSFDKSELQRLWWGKILMMYKKFIYSGMMARWQTEQLNIETGEVEAGYWRTFFHVLKDSYNVWKKDSVIRIKDMTADEKRAFYKTSFDILMFASTFILIAALSGDDDDDEKRSWFQNQSILQIRRLRQDIVFYTVFNEDAFRMIKRPTVIQGTIENWFDFAIQLTDPFEEYKRKTGIYEKGELKIKARVNKLIPIVGPIIRFRTPEEQIKIFNK